MTRLDFYRATPLAMPVTERSLSCPYHSHWVRYGSRYRTCPECLYCVRCRLVNRPVLFPHTHGRPADPGVISYRLALNLFIGAGILTVVLLAVKGLL